MDDPESLLIALAVLLAGVAGLGFLAGARWQRDREALARLHGGGVRGEAPKGPIIPPQGGSGVIRLGIRPVERN